MQEDMENAEERKKKQRNTKEIRISHFNKMLTLEKTYYDKTNINDNILEYPFLHDRKNYMPLGQRFRPFYIKPFYAKRSDFEEKLGW